MLVSDSVPVNNQKDDDYKKSESKQIASSQWCGYAVAALALVIGGAIIVTAACEIALLTYEIAHDKLWKPDLADLEQVVQKKFSLSAVRAFKELTDLDTTRLFKRLALCKEEEQQIINNLFENYHLTSSQLQEMLMGAHIRVDDGGRLFEEWESKIPEHCKNERPSSHPSHAKQYGIRGPLVKELLFSCVREREKNYTWFQLENHPVSFGHIIRHMIDFFKYKLSSRQQGPDGSSPFTDRNPITIMSKRTI